MQRALAALSTAAGIIIAGIGIDPAAAQPVSQPAASPSVQPHATGTPAAAIPAGGSHACSGATCLTVNPSKPVVNVGGNGSRTDLGYALTVTGAGAHARITLHNGPYLVPDQRSVVLDGTPVPTSEVTPSASTLTIAATVLSVGNHTLGYSATLNRTADQTATAGVVLDDGSGSTPATATSEPTQITVQRPDLQILNAHQPLSPLIPGGLSNADLTTYVPGVPARLDLIVPSGFSVSVEDISSNRALTCVPTAPPTGRISCVGDLNQVKTFNLGIRANAKDRIGTAGSIIATLVPIGVPDAKPADNTARIAVTVVGSASLTGTITPQSKALYLNHDTRYTVTITNHGPNTATGITTGIFLRTNTARAFDLSASAPLRFVPYQNDKFPGSAQWRIASLPAGRSVSATVTLRGLRVAATGVLELGIIESATLNSTLCRSAACESAAGQSLIVFAGSPPSTQPATQPGTSSGTGSGLPETGARVGQPLMVAALALLTGAGMLLAAGRRRGKN